MGVEVKKKSDKNAATLEEIDDNLLTTPLTTLEKAEELIWKQKLYENLYPETKKGRNRRIS